MTLAIGPIEVGLLVLVLALSAAGTGLVRLYALRRGILDVPNARSSHSRPTPRGGGAALVAVTLAYVAFAWARGAIDRDVALALGVGGFAVALVGALDDRFQISNAVRLPAWFAIAIFADLVLGGLPVLAVGTWTLPLGVIGHAIVILGVVWMINLYNFMDGIDGLAGAQAVGAASVGGVLLLASDSGLAGVALAMAFAAGGFLVWNWPPAKIFMGDVASGFLGYAFTILAIASEKTGGPSIGVWAILLGVFIVDATLTVARRLARGERLSEAHRSHAYQIAARRARAHLPVTVAIVGINAGLAVAAILAWKLPALLPVVAALVVVALAAAWWAISRRRDETSKYPARV